MIKMKLDVTRISSKGQVVIPQEMRTHLKESEKLVVIQSGKQIILERVRDFGENIIEEIEFAKRTEEAWKRYDRGEFVSRSKEEFLKELEKW
jgi:AbrB family looped-hinge helix DNA binding protein